MALKDVVDRLASAYYQRLVSTWGELPATETEWQALAREIGPTARPLPRDGCMPGFTAHLLFVRAIDRWLIVYSPFSFPRRRCEFITHEIFEYMANEEYQQWFPEEDPREQFTFDGGSDPSDLRHLVAVAGTKLAFPGGTKPTLTDFIASGQLCLAIDIKRGNRHDEK